MSIDVSSGEKLSDLGITDAFDLGKVVSGFNANSNYYGSMVYTLRGIGFQDTALASTNTVSLSLDEMPIPFAAMGSGVILDVQRVEALKGPREPCSDKTLLVAPSTLSQTNPQEILKRESPRAMPVLTNWTLRDL